MSDASANAAQIDYWNAQAGQTWVKHQALLDRQIGGLGLEAMRALGLKPGEAVLDVGCGCGETTAEIARRVGPDGAAVGVDISAPMLEVARTRSIDAGVARPAFRQLDAQSGALGGGAFDAAFSRFGVMFFADPPAAFANIRKALKPSGRLAFVCWRPLELNVWMRAPMEAARDLLPPPARPEPGAPGPFAFADPDRVRGILAKAGFQDVRLDPFDIEIGGFGLDDALTLALRVGPLGAALREHPEQMGAVQAAVRQRLSGYETPRGVRMPAAVWIVQARNPA